MKIISAHIVGLIGIYSKSGISDITIDFTKCMHDIVIIIGENGSGKSTLMEVLQPLPDNANMYLTGMNGFKELVYSDQDLRYKITIEYPISSGTDKRLQTKAFLQEIQPDGTLIDLNPNGNIGSYKDILFSKFGLDPNFVSLSHLSVDKKGIVGKTPSERKKYIANLLDSTEVYNDIYKALVKRSGVFKSMINSITAKIDSIGDEEKLLMDMNSLVSRIAMLSSARDKALYNLTHAQSTIDVLDPDRSIQNKYNSLYTEYSTVTSSIEDLNRALNSSKINFSSEKDALAAYSVEDKLIGSLISNIEFENSNMSSILITKEDEIRAIQLKQQRINTLEVDIKIGDLKSTIAAYRKRIFGYESNFKKIGIHNFEVSKEEYIAGLNILNDLREMIVAMKSYSTSESISTAIQYISNGVQASKELSTLQSTKLKLEGYILNAKDSRQHYIELLSKLKILDGRPSNCTISDCVFIKDALDAQKQSPQDNIDTLNTTIEDLMSQLDSTTHRIEFLTTVNDIQRNINNIIRTINTNKTLLLRLPNGDSYCDADRFISRIECGDMFDDISNLYSNIGYANLLELYKSDKTKLLELENTYALYKGKEEMIDELSADLDKLFSKLNGIESKIESINTNILDLKMKLEDAKNNKNTYSLLIDRYRRFNELKETQKDLDCRLSTIVGNVSKIEEQTMIISTSNTTIANIDSEIAPKTAQLDKIKYSIAKLSEYRVELEQYNSNYTLIETIKKYSSPTKGGIQTLFMKLYMDKTLEMSNQLLSFLFGGVMELLPYKIDENEFKIPCRNSITSIVNDDISSCSTAEQSMISMIMSYVLMSQSSTKYNIMKLDEVDGNLDQENKSAFPTTIRRIMKLLFVEMCIIITHSSEMDLSNADLILLSPVGKEKPPGNIIFSLR